MVRNHIVQPVVEDAQLAAGGQAAVDAEVVPRGLGRSGQDLVHGLAGVAAGIHRHGGLRPQNEVHRGLRQRLAAQMRERQRPQLLGEHDLARDAAPAVQLDMGRGGPRVVVQSAEHAGLRLALHLEDGAGEEVLLRRLYGDAHTAAGPQTGIFLIQIAALLALQAQVHAEAVQHVRPGDLDVPAAVGQIAGPQRDIQLALDDLQIVADGRQSQQDGRDGDIVAVDGVGQPVKAASSAPEECGGHRRHQRDTGLRRQREVQLVGGQTPVVQTLELQLRLRLKQVEGVELQREVVVLLAVEGVDGRLQLCQIKPQQGGGVDLAVGLEALLHEGDGVVLLLLGRIAQGLQLYQLILRAVEDEIQPHLAGQHQIAVGLDLRPVDEALDLRDVNEHQHGVLVRIHAQRQAAVLEHQLRRLRSVVGRTVQLEARGGVPHLGRGVEGRDKAVSVHPDAEVVFAAPHRRDGGGQRRLALGVFVVSAVLIVQRFKIAPQDIQRVAVPLLQRRFPRGVRDGRRRQAPLRLVQAQLIGVLRDRDLIRLGEFHLGGVRRLLLRIHVPEAPDVHGVHGASAAAPAHGSRVALGGQRVRRRVVGHVHRRPDIVGVAQTVDIRQHEGVVHAVAVGIDLRDVALAEGLEHIGAPHTGGDVRGLGGDLAVQRPIGAAQLHMSRRVRLGVSHAGKAVVVLIPPELEFRGHGGLRNQAQSPGRLRRQRVGPAVRVLHDVGDGAVGHTGRQLHKVVADVAQKRRGQSLAVKGVLDGQRILHRRHVHADTGQLRLPGGVDHLHGADGQRLLLPPGLEGEARLLIHAQTEGVPRGRIAPVGVGHGLAHVGAAGGDEHHQLAVVHLQGVDLRAVVHSLLLDGGRRGIHVHALYLAACDGQRLRRQQQDCHQHRQQQGKKPFFHGVSPFFVSRNLCKDLTALL